jgi:phenylacetate-CoA ligase
MTAQKLRSEELYDPDRETLSSDKLSNLQFELLKEAVSHAVHCSPFYQERASRSSTSYNFDSLESFRKKVPFTTKQELRDARPWSTLAVPKRDLHEFHFSSGTSGHPVASYLSHDDVKEASLHLARTWFMQGVRDDSTFAMLASYGLFSAGLLNHYAIEHIGAFILPIGSTPSQKCLDVMQRFEANSMAAVASYYPYLVTMAPQFGLNVRDIGIQHAIAGGEPFSESSRTHIEDAFGCTLLDQYGLCEINTGIAGECAYKNGLHILADYVYPEIVDPNTGQNVPDGVIGELVLTTLKKQATPLLRYRTGDLTSITRAPCRCGRTMPRIARMTRRTIETLFYKGLKIEAPGIHEALTPLAPMVSPDLWILEADSSNGHDTLTLKVALNPLSGNDTLDRVTQVITPLIPARITVVSFTLEELHHLGVGKHKHIKDTREQS